MIQIESNDREFHGKWIFENNTMVEDETSKKIYFLVDKYLKKIASANWKNLYQDPNDKRYWELVYLHSEMNGGGPPSLVNIEKDTAELEYNIELNE